MTTTPSRGSIAEITAAVERVIAAVQLDDETARLTTLSLAIMVEGRKQGFNDVEVMRTFLEAAINGSRVRGRQ